MSAAPTLVTGGAAKALAALKSWDDDFTDGARVVQFRTAANDKSSPKRTTDTAPPPDCVFDVGGAVKMMLEFCVDGAPSPQPFLALGTALATVGVVAGRRYSSPSGLRTNLSIIELGDSASGKDFPRRRAQAALYDAGLDRYLGGEDLSSGQAVMTALESHPVKLFLIDEFGHFISCATGQKAPVHKMEIVSQLTKLATSAGSVVIGKEYARQKGQGANPRVDIYQPHVCVHGSTVPGTLWGAIRSHGLKDGSLSRYLTFQTPKDYPDPDLDAVAGPAPGELIEALRAIAAGVLGHDYGGNLASSMSGATDMTPYTVPYGDRVRAEVNRQRLAQVERLREKRGTFASAFEGRYCEHMVRVAMIHAIGRCPAAPIIELTDINWASALVRHCIDTVLREATDNVSDDKGEALAKEILRFIRDGGASGVNRRDVTRKFQGNPRLRDEILTDLAHSEFITEIPITGKTGQKTSKYFAEAEPAVL